MSRVRFYITTAIDYANGLPHLGHAFEKIGADVIARYHRLLGEDVRFLIGMDEHGQKVAQTAAERGMTPQALADDVSDRFREAWDSLNISYDQFIRTTDPHHKVGVQALIERIFKHNPDDFYERSYEGWYCVGCEQFKKDSEIVEGKCTLHPTRLLEWSEEQNWFFRLSRYSAFLKDLLEERPDFLQPDSRRNEILALIDSGLEDISITRSRLDWAIPFPRKSSNGEEQGTWVWFDALPNYLTATGFPDDSFQQWWPAQLHVIGKDITRLHAVIWPAMLESARLPLPQRVWAHGFVNLAGERFSKSAGVTLDLSGAIDRYGPDAFRYFLLREIPWDDDGNFSIERFDERYTAELANDFGNLVNRSLSMVVRYRDGIVPTNAGNAELDAAAQTAVGRYMDRMNAQRLHEGAAAVFALISEANGFVEAQAPWKLAKDPARASDLDDVLASLVRTIAIVATLLFPFMPRKMADLWKRLGAEQGNLPQLAELGALDAGGWSVTTGEVLFPRPDLAASA
ncbi:MAG TPA: methionine--tRNA ligase [Longimicrobiaceae bacterium]|nr:methionine--tRNA ligase [Longimicrobiaceae bacterium]